MESIYVSNDLIQFNTFVEPENYSCNQFLLRTEQPLLVHTGTHQDVVALLLQLEAILDGRSLEYVFISHFESDECGGLNLLLRHHPDAKILCSAVTARQLSGFGMTDSALIQSSGQFLRTDECEFEFFSYPSEIHLGEGLMLFEKKRSLLFSSDLFSQPGKAEDSAGASDFKTLVDGISAGEIPSLSALAAVKESLASLSVKIIAPGHGGCIRL
jgi:flavorubredoxin